MPPCLMNKMGSMSNQSLLELLSELNCIIDTKEPMSRYVTFKTGGKAPFVVTPRDEIALCQIVKIFNDRAIDYLTIGNGSNLLVADAGLSQPILRLAEPLDKIELLSQTKIRAYAGAKLSALCNFACRSCLSGLEFAFGIPGNVGGAVYMNAGAYGGELSNSIVSVRAVNTDGEIFTLEASELELSYRDSIFHRRAWIILSADFQLKEGQQAVIKAAMEDYLARRRDKQPLEYPSAGSTFKRPVGHFAGALIEQAGLKGYSIGGAMVSKKHAGFVINYNNASTEDIRQLMRHIQDTVFEKFGVMLEPEVIYLE